VTDAGHALACPATFSDTAARVGAGFVSPESQLLRLQAQEAVHTRILFRTSVIEVKVTGDTCL